MKNKQKQVEMKRQLRVESFFAGCGGLDLGFEQAGFEVTWANENERTACKTYVTNHPKTKLVEMDIHKIHPEDIPEVDGFIGGTPCQPWSVAGRQEGLNDGRGHLFISFINMILTKHPVFFLIENVKGMLDEKFNKTFVHFLRILDEDGYNVYFKLLNAVNYRVPQSRERVFIVGFDKTLKINYAFPSQTCDNPITLKLAIGDITENPRRIDANYFSKCNSNRPNHDVYSGSFGSFYRRGNRLRGWNQPSFTIHATGENAPLHPSSPKMKYFAHENWGFQEDRMNEYRRLSVRECARIQTFPDCFKIEGNDILAQYKMIGNAVPPRLGCVLAKSIVESLSKVDYEQR